MAPLIPPTVQRTLVVALLVGGMFAGLTAIVQTMLGHGWAALDPVTVALLTAAGWIAGDAINRAG